jgi:NAD(P)-dependent dehydrogenase (short-subunit alcohol dehydrogenase family)
MHRLRFGLFNSMNTKFCYNSIKAAVSHLTKLLSTEIGLKNIPVRVNAIAPGTYESEMTLAEITPDIVNKIGNNLLPLPAGRAGT